MRLQKWSSRLGRNADKGQAPQSEIRKTALCKWGVSNQAGGEPCLFAGWVLLHKKSLGHPAKAQNLKSIKLGFHPQTKPTCPRGGSLNCRLSPLGAWWRVLMHISRLSYQHSLTRRSSVAKKLYNII